MNGFRFVFRLKIKKKTYLFLIANFFFFISNHTHGQIGFHFDNNNNIVENEKKDAKRYSSYDDDHRSVKIYI